MLTEACGDTVTDIFRVHKRCIVLNKSPSFGIQKTSQISHPLQSIVLAVDDPGAIQELITRLQILNAQGLCFVSPPGLNRSYNSF
jgi:hypothetical protein